ncbi:MAG: hypothetical protein QNJ92_09455 [Alphaproteobacteria bacterium]|nr:hypothetical protein [Alphaproteobacteria bacterium]
MDRCVLLYCAHPTAVQPYVEIAKALAERFEVRPVLLVKSKDVAAYRMLEQHVVPELPVRILSTFAPVVGLFRRVLWQLNQLISHVPVPQIQMLSALVHRIEDCRARSLMVLDSLAPVLAVVPDDRRPVVTLPFLHACRQRGVPVLLHSGAHLSPPAIIQRRRLSRSDTAARGWRAAIARCLPTSARRVGDHTALFFDQLTALALRLCGLSVRNPWVMGGSGYVDRLTIQDLWEMTEILSDPGWKPAKISVVGTPNLDALTRQTPNPTSESSIPIVAVNDRPLAIFAVPQRFSDAPNFTTAELQCTLDALTEAGFSVLLSLHPKSPRDTVDALVRPCGLVTLAEIPLSGILPRAEVFLASYSTTITWAGALGVASAVIDFHEENSAVYENVPAVPVLRSPKEVGDWARSMAMPDQRHAAAIAMKAAFAERIVITGTAAHDLANLCAELGGFASARPEGSATT